MNTTDPKKQQRIEIRKQRIEQLKQDAELMSLVMTDIRYDAHMGPTRLILNQRINNNILDRLLIQKEIEIINQQPHDEL